MNTQDEYGFACEVCDKWTFGVGEMPQYPDAVCGECGRVQERPLTEHKAH